MRPASSIIYPHHNIHRPDALRFQQRRHSERNHEPRPVPLRQTPQRGTNPGERADAFRPHRIRQQISAALLQLYCGVVNYGHPQVLALHIAGCLRRNHVVNKAWRRSDRVVNFHLSTSGNPLSWARRIEVPFAGKCFGKGTGPGVFCTILCLLTASPTDDSCAHIAGLHRTCGIL